MRVRVGGDLFSNAWVETAPGIVAQRAKYHAMVTWIDGAVGRVVQSLKEEGLYDDTLICMNSDNGGPLPSGNNYPLKGGKFSNWCALAAACRSTREQ